MKKIILILTLITSSLFAEFPECHVWEGQDVKLGAIHNVSHSLVSTASVACENFYPPYSSGFTWGDAINGAAAYDYVYSSEYDSDGVVHCYRDGQYANYNDVAICCESPMVPNSDNSACVCPSGLEFVAPDSCPIGTDIAPSCMEPCPEGTSRQGDGTCCVSPLGKTCTANGWSSCLCGGTDEPLADGTCPDLSDSNGTCPAGQEKDRFGACVEMCPAGEYRDLTNECSPVPDCADNEDFNTTSAKCEAKPQNPDDDNPNCTECEERGQQRLEECSKLGNGSFLEGFKCQENDTCEVTTYNSGVCTDNDNDPRDPNYGDGSQGNNDNTDDIPNSKEENLTQTTQTNDDGTQTTTTKQRNYDDAFEAIGDNIDDSRKATNAQTKANKQNTEFLGKKIDKSNEHLKNIEDSLKFDASKKADDFTIDEDKYNLNADALIDYVTNALTPMIDYTTGKVDVVWDGIKNKYKNKVFFSENCQRFNEVSETITKGSVTKKITIWSQERVDQYNLVLVIKPIVIFGFTLAGLMAVFREM